ncbi:MAG: uroporphyrinogen decarboxylase [Nitrospirae bacterium]|nr:uroporphyrinogen decarboxylase [Nitrospirota bacterium]
MNDTFLRVCKGQEVSYTPVWLMRQAGRYMPEYQAVRADVDFLTLCKSPELATKVTLQPVDILGVDAAILFSDILVLPEAMGMRLEFHEKKGPQLSEPIRSRSLTERLRVPYPEDDLGFVLETIRLLREKLDVPLIGFSGAPFTLATYMIEGEGSRNFINTKKMMFSAEGLFQYLMEKITDSVIQYLSAQIRAGAQAVQLFDTWAGILSPDDYRSFALPYVKRAASELKKEGVPVIYFVYGSAGILKDIKRAGADVIGIDWKVDMADAVKALGKKVSVQGNLDPLLLFLPEDKLRERVKNILIKASPAKGHIFNLGHGILPETPVSAVKALVRLVHELSRELKGR